MDKIDIDAHRYDVTNNNIGWFIQLRWLIVVVLFLAGLAGPYLERYLVIISNFPYRFFSELAVILLMLNIGYTIHYRVSKNYRAMLVNQYVQICIDLIAVAFLAYFLGGIQSPFIFTFLFHITLLCIFLNRYVSFGFTVATTIIIASFTLLELWQFIPQQYVFDSGYKKLAYQNHYYIAFYLIGIFVISLGVWYLVSTLGNHLREYRESVINYNRKLIDLSQERSRFMLLTSHELKAPLAAVQTYAQVLLKGYQGELPDKVNEVLGRIHERCHKLNTQIKDMIQLANVSSIVTEDLEMKLVASR